MLKAIFFDLDGTLCRFHGNFKEIFTSCFSAINQSNPSLAPEALLDHWNIILRKEGASTSRSLIERVCNDLNVTLPAAYPELIKNFCQTYANHISPIEGVHELLSSLSSRYKLALITNGPMDLQNAAIDASGIRTYFETILISGDPLVTYRKPNPEVFKMALKITETNHQESLMIGDKIDVDLDGAKKLGMHTLFVGKTNDANVNSIEAIHHLTTILERDFSSTHDVTHSTTSCSKSR